MTVIVAILSLLASDIKPIAIVAPAPVTHVWDDEFADSVVTHLVIRNVQNEKNTPYEEYLKDDTTDVFIWSKEGLSMKTARRNGSKMSACDVFSKMVYLDLLYPTYLHLEMGSCRFRRGTIHHFRQESRRVVLELVEDDSHLLTYR